MSTRSVIVVTGKTIRGQDRTTRLYKHSDGYPTGNLPIIATAIEWAKDQRAKGEKYLRMDRVVDFIAGKTDFGGTGARLEESYSEAFHPSHLGSQGDLEWVYVVDCDDEAVYVFGGGYTGELPQKAYYKGTVEPRTYIKQLKSEYQYRELQAIEEAIAAIEATGFKVNPSRLRGTGNGSPVKSERKSTTKITTLRAEAA